MIAWKWSMLLEEKVPIVENLVYDKKKKKKAINSGTFNSHILWFLWIIMISINWGNRSKRAKSKELKVMCLNGGTHWALPASFGFCSFLEARTMLKLLILAKPAPLTWSPPYF